jgi:uncharacterized membrane protein YagU involved in acid resistance
MPEFGVTHPETVIDVLFGCVAGISGLVATYRASRLAQTAQKPRTVTILIIGFLFVVCFSLLFAVTYRVYANLTTPIPALPGSLIAGCATTLFIMVPLLTIHSFILNLLKQGKDNHHSD